MSRIIDEAIRRTYHKNRPTMSVLQVEFVIPKAWTNKLLENSGHESDPIPKMVELLETFLDDYVELIGFKIID